FDVVETLARRAGHPFTDRAAFEARRRSMGGAEGFLSLYADVCRLFQRPEDYAEAARRIPQALWDGGVRYAELYVSPEIFRRMGVDSAACLSAIDDGLAAGEKAGGAVCRILLDTVRQWGPEAADRVLDLYEKQPIESIVGFGMGGDEGSLPSVSFAGV